RGLQPRMKQQRLDQAAAGADITGLNVDQPVELQQPTINEREQIHGDRKLEHTGHRKSRISVVDDTVLCLDMLRTDANRSAYGCGDSCQFCVESVHRVASAGRASERPKESSICTGDGQLDFGATYALRLWYNGWTRSTGISCGVLSCVGCIRNAEEGDADTPRRLPGEWFAIRPASERLSDPFRRRQCADRLW